jgi:phosphatidylserine/phosphatidylglycerophosphate/cardiolipin synthase-like enzyme
VSNYDLAVGSVNAFVYTSPHASADLDPAPALIAALNAAKKTIFFATYSFTYAPFADALIAAHARGVQVRGVADASEAGQVNGQVPRLVAAGIDVKRWGSTFRLMHEKAFVVDGNSVGLGSYNWTTQAEKSNVEILLIAKGAQVARVLAPTMTAQIQASYDAGATLAAPAS